MYERFTDRARKAIALAHQDAPAAPCSGRGCRAYSARYPRRRKWRCGTRASRLGARLGTAFGSRFTMPQIDSVSAGRECRSRNTSRDDLAGGIRPLSAIPCRSKGPAFAASGRKQAIDSTRHGRISLARPQLHRHGTSLAWSLMSAEQRRVAIVGRARPDAGSSSTQHARTFGPRIIA